MSTNQEGVHASVRTITGTSRDYLSDWHALFDSYSITAGPWNGRALAFFNTYLGTSYTALNTAMNAFAIGQGFADWEDMTGFTLSEAAQMLAAETQGLAISFTDDAFLGRDLFYGSAEIKDTGTPANNYSAAPDKTASSLLTYTSPSVKMCLGPTGTYRYGAHNLCLRSEDVTNGAWSAVGVTTPAIDTITENSSSSTHGIAVTSNITISNGADYSFSVELKANGRRYVAVFADGSGGTLGSAAGFDLQDGVLTNGTGSIEDAGSGWYRITLNRTASNTTARPAVYMRTTAGTLAETYLGNGASGIFIRKAHLRATPSDSTYLKTTSAARYALPIEFNTSNVSQGLLVEESRTNLALYSQTFDNAAWVNEQSTEAAGAAVAPDGTTTAYSLTDDAVSNNHIIYQQMSVFASTAHSASCFIKAGTATFAHLLLLTNAGGTEGYGVNVNLSTGAVTTTNDVGSPTGKSNSVTNCGNGWYRVSLTVTAPAANGGAGYLAVSLSNSASPSYTNGRPSYSGTGSTIYIWGAQLEVGAFPTSYIHVPAASTVTRAVDNISLATTAFPFGGGTANTVFVEFNCGPDYTALGGILGDASVDTFAYRSGASLVAYDGTDVHTYSGSALVNNATVKAALAWSGTSSSSSTNGATVQTGTAYRYTTVSSLVLGGIFGSAGGVVRLRKVMVLPRRQTDPQLVTTTT